MIISGLNEKKTHVEIFCVIPSTKLNLAGHDNDVIAYSKKLLIGARPIWDFFGPIPIQGSNKFLLSNISADIVYI